MESRFENSIINNDALSALRSLPNKMVDCCVTSPPYYGLRDYGSMEQIGLEKTPTEYLKKLVDIFEEVRRVLKDDGTLWINISDSYSGSISGSGNIKTKNLMGIPWKLALALQDRGWYLRQDIIWSKPNPMPESVKDRCTKSHEYIFLLSKSKKYYFDFKAIMEPAVGFNNVLPAGSKGTMTPNSRRRKGNAKTFRGGGIYTGGKSFNNSEKGERESHGNCENITGLRRKRSVWTIATQGIKEAHFATFPEKLIEPCILAGCKKGGIVLDPFLGSGTTAVVAKKYERNYIGIEINEKYINIAKKRIDKA